MSIKTFFLLVLVIGIIIVSGYIYYQSRSFSKEVLKLEILGPDKAEMAEEVEYTVKFKNQGDVNLQDPKLIFEYPQDSLLSEGESLRKEMKLETIYPGQERTISFKTRLFGREGEQKVAKAWLQYRPKNLKSHYESATTKTTVISSVPINLEMDLPSKIEPGREVNLQINYFSNADYPLSDLRILVDYPAGFEFLGARPFSLEKNEWKLPLLNKAQGGRIEIRGKFSGEVGEEKIIKAKLGMWQGDNFILLKEIIRGVEMARSQIYLSQQINGNPQYIASPGDTLHYEIFFKNIGSKPLTNLFLVAKLEGRAFDLQTLKSDQGSFKPGDNSIIFDDRSVSKLQFLDSQEEGKVEFWVDLKKDWQILGPQDKNVVIKDTVSLSQAKEEFVTKVNSKLEISSEAYFENPPQDIFFGKETKESEGKETLPVFKNTGPLPPEEGQTTTFTVVWQAKNYYNDLSNVKVKATLPKDVKLTGEIFPKEAKLTFDSQSREVVWDIGEMKAGEGVLSEPAKVAFQIALKPSKREKEGEGGKISFLLVGEAKITGEDTWTEQELEALSPPIKWQ